MIPCFPRNRAAAAAATRLGACAAMVALAGAGCFPMVTHSPVVHPGVSGGGVFGLTTGAVFNSADAGRVTPGIYPLPQLIVRQGWTAGPFGQPAHVGLQLQPFALVPGLQDHDTREALLGSEADLYTQIGGGGWNRGVGALVGREHASLYYEAGPANADWYMVHQVAVIDAGNANRVYGWGSGIARTEAGRHAGSAAQLGLTAVVGVHRPAPNLYDQRRTAVLLLIGTVSLEWFERPH